MSQYAKAIVAFFTTTAGSATTVLADGSVTPLEVVVAVCTVGAATFGVWAKRNA